MKKILAILIVVLAVVLLAGASFAYAQFNRPLNPPLDLVPPPAGAVAAQSPRPVVHNPAPQSQQEKTCGRSGSLTLLSIGLTTPDEGPLEGADAVRLMKVDFDNKLVTVVALPPRLWVQTPALAGQGVEEAELTSVYLYAEQAAQGNAQAVALKATKVFAQTLVDNFAFLPDYYLTLDQPVFAGMVDTVGGIDIDLPVAVDGTPDGFGAFVAGPQHMTGQLALDYMRILRPAGVANPTEWDRFERQNQVIQALIQESIDPQNWDKAPGLIQQFRQGLFTDLSPNLLLDLGCMAREDSVDKVMLSLPPDMAPADAAGRLLPDTPAITQFIQDNLGN